MIANGTLNNCEQMNLMSKHMRVFYGPQSLSCSLVNTDSHPTAAAAISPPENL